MARRKGASKSTIQPQTSDITEKGEAHHKYTKIEPGGELNGKHCYVSEERLNDMEIPDASSNFILTHRLEGILNQQNMKDKIMLSSLNEKIQSNNGSSYSSINNNNCNNDSLKYLHKKFKRIASATNVVSSGCTITDAPKTTNIELTNSRQNYFSYSEQKNSSLYENSGSFSQGCAKIFENGSNIRLIDTSSYDDNNDRQHRVPSFSIKSTSSISSEHNQLIGRHVCPYCNLNCTKPSVLKKHIRSHTNERPYPCETCGFAFKTKSNYYKHCRSRSHEQRVKGIDPNPDTDEGCLESDQDLELSNSSSEMFSPAKSPQEDRTSPFQINRQTNNIHIIPSLSLTQVKNKINTNEKPYKPKFHSASLYASREDPFATNNIHIKEAVKKMEESNVLKEPNDLHVQTLKNNVEQILSPTERNEIFFHSEVEQHHGTHSINQGPVSTSYSHLPNMSFISTNVEFIQEFQERISKIISQNEAIVENKEILLQKKYPKTLSRSKSMNYTHANIISGSSNGSVDENTILKLSQSIITKEQRLLPQSTAFDEKIIQRQPLLNPCLSVEFKTPKKLQAVAAIVVNNQLNSMATMSIPSSAQPLNLSKPSDYGMENMSLCSTLIDEDESVLNVNKSQCITPQRSIIKDLLLNARGMGIPSGEGDDAVYRCPLCKMNFRTADELKLHTSNYCQGSRSGIISPPSSPSQSYFQTSSLNANYPQLTKPNSLVKLARSSFLLSKNPLSLAKLAWSQLKTKPSNLVLNQLNIVTNINGSQSERIQQKLIDAPLPSPGPLLGKTPLIEDYNHNERKSEDVVITKVHGEHNVDKNYNTQAKSLATISQEHLNIIKSRKIKPLTYFSVNSQENQCNEDVVQHPQKEVGTKQYNFGSGCKTPISQYYNLERYKKTYTPWMMGESNPEVTHVMKEIQQQKLFDSVESTSILENPLSLQKFPINSITAFNPLTLPPIKSKSSLVGHTDKNIPHVPGIPGPNSMISKLSEHEPTAIQCVNNSPSICDSSNYILCQNLPNTKFPDFTPKFNFTRIAENVSPKKQLLKSPEKEIRHFNFDNNKNTNNNTQRLEFSPLHVDVTQSVQNTHIDLQPDQDKLNRSKFLRPSSLSLKPGTFTPKRHHGITPTANTLPLISPETPRPSKACVQLYLNGHAYTYLGLKCSTKMFYCTVSCPQPSYVANLHKLSMYSVWQVCAENNPHPIGLKPKAVMSLYDSRQRIQTYTMSFCKKNFDVINSQALITTPFENNIGVNTHQYIPSPSSSTSSIKNEFLGHTRKKAIQQNGPSNRVLGGYESNDDYTYIRGRGRGRYVCSECGIRCKKPSMLKKHIRTHTDLRPFRCQHCKFSFKTKGNLTKHMQSKTHYKKCLELGINPGPMPVDGEFGEDYDYDQQSVTSGGGGTSSVPGESDSDEFSDDESSDADESKSRLPEHEAARCLLSLSMTPPNICISPQPSVSAEHQHQEFQQIPSVNISNIRLATFSSTKPPINYPKQEQYYYNPVELKRGIMRSSADISVNPIDLTKPRPPLDRKFSKYAEIQCLEMNEKSIIGGFSDESGVLKSVISITDKVRESLNNYCTKEDESQLLQVYLTEQALKYSKIKQSQMSSTFSDTLVVNTKTTCTSSSIAIDVVSSNESFLPLNITEVVRSKNKEDVKTKPIGAAKTVASEYLKITTMKIRSASKVEESEDSMSDQEMISNENLKSNSDFSGFLSRTVIVGEDGFKNPSKEVQPVFPRVPISDDGRAVCKMCPKTFQKQHQLVLHMYIHYMERKYKCEACGVSFRTQGHLQKHERSEGHKNKVMVTSTFGVPTTSNPRPFECTDCKIAFRIHGHLAKHLRSKTHVQKLECLQKLPFGTYAEIERAGINLTEIDTTDCENSMLSLKLLAEKLMDKEPNKISYINSSNILDANVESLDNSGIEDNHDVQTTAGNSILLGSEENSNLSTGGIKRNYSQLSIANDDLDNEHIKEKRKRTFGGIRSN